MVMRLINREGFSLIELLVGMVILGIILTAAYQLFISANKSQIAQDLEVEMQQNARTAADFIVRELRNSGAISSDPNFCMENTTSTCPSTGIPNLTDKIRFTSVTDSNTRKFSWNSADNTLQFFDPSISPDRQALSDNITTITFNPFDQNNNSTTVLSNVKRIDITITARTSRIDPNTKGYRTYSTKTSVMKRN
jgi:prepilin-type N-terminal cleavage/methylation domain-containing protein